MRHLALLECLNSWEGPRCEMFNPKNRSLKNLGGWKRCQFGLVLQILLLITFSFQRTLGIMYVISSAASDTRKKKHPTIQCHSTASCYHQASSSSNLYLFTNLHTGLLPGAAAPTARVQWKTERPPVVEWQDGQWVVVKYVDGHFVLLVQCRNKCLASQVW